MTLSKTQQFIEDDFFKPLYEKYKGLMEETPEKVININGVERKRTKELLHKEFEKVLSIVNNKFPVYLSGPAGTGKTTIASKVAETLELEFYMNIKLTDVFELIGFIDAKGNYVETEFYKAFTQGSLYFIDEIDSSDPSVLVAINAAIANRKMVFPNGTVDAHEKFCIIVAGNTNGSGANENYNTRNLIDAATLDRFIILNIDYDERIEKEVAGGDGNIVKLVNKLRTIDTPFRSVFSTRFIQKFVLLKNQGFSKEEITTVLFTDYDTYYKDEVDKLVDAALKSKNGRKTEKPATLSEIFDI